MRWRALSQRWHGLWQPRAMATTGAGCWGLCFRSELPSYCQLHVPGNSVCGPVSSPALGVPSESLPSNPSTQACACGSRSRGKWIRGGLHKGVGKRWLQGKARTFLLERARTEVSGFGRRCKPACKPARAELGLTKGGAAHEHGRHAGRIEFRVPTSDRGPTSRACWVRVRLC